MNYGKVHRSDQLKTFYNKFCCWKWTKAVATAQFIINMLTFYAVNRTGEDYLKALEKKRKNPNCE